YPNISSKPRWPNGKVSTLGLEGSGSKPDFTEDPSCIGLLHVKSYVGGQMSSRWCGAEVWRGAQVSSSSSDQATGKLVSTSTVRGRLHEDGQYARRLAVCVPLTSRHRRELLRWAHQHVHWTSNQWRTVFFTDESSLSLQSDSRCYLIWRETGTRYHQSNNRERNAYGGGSVCVWGGVSLGGRTDLHVFPRGTVNK
ncbi:hypothetical protein AVEN_263486-2-1, partial [Araneus ventricosus]